MTRKKIIYDIIFRALIQIRANQLGENKLKFYYISSILHNLPLKLLDNKNTYEDLFNDIYESAKYVNVEYFIDDFLINNCSSLDKKQIVYNILNEGFREIKKEYKDTEDRKSYLLSLLFLDLPLQLSVKNPNYDSIYSALYKRAKSLKIEKWIDNTLKEIGVSVDDE